MRPIGFRRKISVKTPLQDVKSILDNGGLDTTACCRYEAEIALATEKYCYHPKTGECEGVDPDTYQDHGVIETIKAPTLEELKIKIARQFFNLEKPIGADVQIFEGRLEIVCDSDTVNNQLDSYSIMIFKVESTVIDLSNEPLFKGVAR